MTFDCPNCGAAIPLAQNTAPTWNQELECVACRHKLIAKQALKEPQRSAIALVPPPSGSSITRRQVSPTRVAFHIGGRLSLRALVGGAGLSIAMLMEDMHWFWHAALWAVVLGALVDSISDRILIVDGRTMELRGGFFGIRRSVRLVTTGAHASVVGADGAARVVEVTSGGKRLVLGVEATVAEKDWLAAEINALLGSRQDQTE